MRTMPHSEILSGNKVSFSWLKVLRVRILCYAVMYDFATLMYIKIKVFPDAKKYIFEPRPGSVDAFFAHVKEPASNNLANKRVLYLVAQHFNIPQKQLRIITGHTSPNKIIEIPDEQ
jgi:uncharacterized protein YggU (UPF0235/DUF167 family)